MILQLSINISVNVKPSSSSGETPTSTFKMTMMTHVSPTATQPHQPEVADSSFHPTFVKQMDAEDHMSSDCLKGQPGSLESQGQQPSDSGDYRDQSLNSLRSTTSDQYDGMYSCKCSITDMYTWNMVSWITCEHDLHRVFRGFQHV